MPSKVSTKILEYWWGLWKTFCSLPSHICECSNRPQETHTHSSSESHSFNKRDMKTFYRHPRLSPEIISHHINHSVWNRGEKADKLKRRQEQLFDTCPGHSRVICTFGNKSWEALIGTLAPILTLTKILNLLPLWGNFHFNILKLPWEISRKGSQVSRAVNLSCPRVLYSWSITDCCKRHKHWWLIQLAKPNCGFWVTGVDHLRIYIKT